MIRESEVLVYAVGIDGDGRLHVERAVPAATDADPAAVSRSRVAAAAVAADRRPAAISARPRPRRRRPAASWSARLDPARRPRQRRGAEGADRRQRRPDRDRRVVARSRARDHQHRRRVEPAVLPRLPGGGEEGRPLAHDPRRGARRPLHASARAGATSRANGSRRSIGRSGQTDRRARVVDPTTWRPERPVYDLAACLLCPQPSACRSSAASAAFSAPRCCSCCRPQRGRSWCRGS